MTSSASCSTCPGRKGRRRNPSDAEIETDVPHLRIIDQSAWDAVEARLAAEALPAASEGNQQTGFWDRRRPRHLVTRKVFCGVCQRAFGPTSND